ncbi:hypothetical protein [Promicromonospora sp. NPDC023805]|uniref:hypothetical protein n=1 Tax=Promicromonospora sp. NPDC023805 TaxID=3154696 RepID=UPI0033FFF280
MSTTPGTGDHIEQHGTGHIGKIVGQVFQGDAYFLQSQALTFAQELRQHATPTDAQELSAALDIATSPTASSEEKGRARARATAVAQRIGTVAPQMLGTANQLINLLGQLPI